MAKKWLDSTDKQKEEAMFVTDRQTDRQTTYIQTESTTKK